MKFVLIGGVVFGVVFGILFINFGNCICCVWVIGGGVLGIFFYLCEVFFLVDLLYGDVVIVGVFVGFIGVFILMVFLMFFGMMISFVDFFGCLVMIMEG